MSKVVINLKISKINNIKYNNNIFKASVVKYKIKKKAIYI